VTPRLRPLRIGEILDVTIKLYLRNARTLLLLVLVIAGPLHLLAVLIGLSTAPADRAGFGAFGQSSSSPSIHRLSASSVTGQILVVLLDFVVSTLATAVCFKAVSDAYLGERPAVGPSLRFVGRRLPAVAWVTLLFYVGLIPAFILLFVPGIWLGIAWIVAVPALLLEGCRGSKALRRSFRLVRGRWWPTFGALAVGYVLASVVSAILVEVLILPFGFSATTDAAVIANELAMAVAAVLVTPFTAALTAVIYYDLRVRKEGFDVTLLAERLGLAVPVGAERSQPDESPEPAGGSRPPFWPPPPGWSATGE